MRNTEEATQAISENPPPNRAWKFTSQNKANAEIWRLQAILGEKESPFCFNLSSANKRVDQLAERIAEKGISAVAVVPAAHVPAVIQAVAKPANVEMPGDEMQLTTTASEFIRMNPADREIFGTSKGIMSRSEFEKLNPASKAAYCKCGGKLQDVTITLPRATHSTEPIPAKPGFDRLGNKVDFAQNGEPITRAKFDTLSPQEKMEHCRKGGRIAD